MQVKEPLNAAEIIMSAPRLEPAVRAKAGKNIRLIEAFLRHGMLTQSQADALISQVIKKVAIRDLTRFAPDRRIVRTSMTRTLGEVRARRTIES